MHFNRENFKTCLTFLILAALVFLCNGKEQISKAEITQLTNFQPISSTNAAVKLTAANAINISTPKDGLNKRNIKANDLSSSDKVSAKSYDPPPEFYRGPASTATSNKVSSTTAYTSSPYTSKPVSFPDTADRIKKYTDNSRGGGTAKDYNKWQLQQGPTQGYGDLEDRISVGHYGSADHSTTHGGSSASYLHGSGISAGYGSSIGYSGDYDAGRPYHNDYDGGPRHPAHGNGYYIGSHTDEIGGIPFDVYGSKGHYAGAGGEYSYSSYPEVHIHETVAHKGHGYGGFGGVDWQRKALLAKSFLIPLASAAVLGIAAAFASNPLLLQLGTVSGPAVIGKRRKRRDLNRPSFESFTEPQSARQSLAYRHAHRRHERRLARV